MLEKEKFELKSKLSESERELKDERVRHLQKVSQLTAKLAAAHSEVEDAGSELLKMR